MQYFYNAFWNILQYFYNGRCKCVRIKNYCSEAVSKAVIIRGESVRCIIVSYECNRSTPHGDQNRREQSKTRYNIQHNTVPKEALKWRAREECARFNKYESFLWRAKVSDTLLQSYPNQVVMKPSEASLCGLLQEAIVLIKLEIESDWR